jgi:hypothetical protein
LFGTTDVCSFRVFVTESIKRGAITVYAIIEFRVTVQFKWRYVVSFISRIKQCLIFTIQFIITNSI